MSQIKAGISSDFELELELPDDGRETPGVSSTGSNTADVITTTPGNNRDGDDGDDGDQGS